MSGKFVLDYSDWKKIGTGAVMALTGAVVVFLTDITNMVDWGTWSPIVAAIASIAANSLRKFLTDNAAK